MVYTTPAKVAALLGVTLTAGQQTLVTDALEPAMALYIERVTGRAWATASPVTAELHTVPSDGVVYLKNRPVAAISAATVRTASIGADPTALVADSTYELLDAANGVLLVSAFEGSLLSVNYTHTAAVPADIGLAATWLVAAQMSDVLVSDPSLRGVKKYTVGQGDLSIEFDSQAAASQAQKGLDILAARKAFVFA